MAEVVGIFALLADDSLAPALIQCGNEEIFTEIGSVGQDAVGERAADDRRQIDHLPRARRKL